MFHFPWFALTALCIQTVVPQLFAAVGFPIRTSSDQRLVGNSPKLFAATHVLHRLSAPRHPPHALSSLLNLNLTCATPASRQSFAQELETKVQAPALRSKPKRIIFARLRVSSMSNVTLLSRNFASTLRMHLSKNVSRSLPRDFKLWS
jgi:hypothetical protein